MKRASLALIVLAACGKPQNVPDVEYILANGCKAAVRPTDGGCLVLDGNAAVTHFVVPCGGAIATCGLTGTCACPWDSTVALPHRHGWRPWKQF